MSLGVVILAAGESARMGEPKQLLPFRGTTLLGHAIATARDVPEAEIVVVLGAHAAQIRPHVAASDPRVFVAENPAWAEGMAGSIRVGLRTLLDVRPQISAALFLVCDQPLLISAVLHDLVEAHARTGQPIAACEYGGTLGVPALFSRALFPELLALQGTSGARQLIQRHREETVGVPWEAATMDVDTPADYAKLRVAAP
jgi:molybdenum cofactor cytidylyltransferase